VEGRRIQLEDGRTLPHNYRQFDHGYAVTAHRSQGKTVDAVIVSGDRMAQELFYVAVSRGRESLTVVTSDKAELERSVGVSAERQSATELARKAERAIIDCRGSLLVSTSNRLATGSCTWPLLTGSGNRPKLRSRPWGNKLRRNSGQHQRCTFRKCR